MARIRTIKPEFWTSEQVLECSRDARLMWIGLWNFSDDSGRHPGSARQIKAEIFPADDCTADDVRGWLAELSENGLVQMYVVDGKEYIQTTGWHHQRIDKAQPAKYPPPPQDLSKNDPGSFPPERKGRESIGREGKGRARAEPEAKPAAAPPSEPVRPSEDFKKLRSETVEAAERLMGEVATLYEARWPSPKDVLDHAVHWLRYGREAVLQTCRDDIAKRQAKGLPLAPKRGPAHVTDELKFHEGKSTANGVEVPQVSSDPWRRKAQQSQDPAYQNLAWLDRDDVIALLARFIQTGAWPENHGPKPDGEFDDRPVIKIHWPNAQAEVEAKRPRRALRPAPEVVQPAEPSSSAD